MGKVLPSQRLLKQFEERLVFGEMNLSEVVRSGAQMMLQYALEREVTEALGRNYYENAPATTKEKGRRNGYESHRVLTGEGAVGRCHRFRRRCSHAICVVIYRRTHRLSCLEVWTSLFPTTSPTRKAWERRGSGASPRSARSTVNGCSFQSSSVGCPLRGWLAWSARFRTSSTAIVIR